MALGPDERARVQELLDRLESDDFQQRLRSGFERDFSNSILNQWAERGWLSDRQIEILEDILTRHERR